MNSDLVQYTPIVDAVLDGARNLTARDFVDLAIAALDQAGMPPELQDHVRHLAGNRLAIEAARQACDRADASIERAEAVDVDGLVFADGRRAG